ncbi:MAG: DsbA family protein [Desulfamplus sp.]|nr:DsbA family protein [Desulfamplus sp.]
MSIEKIEKEYPIEVKWRDFPLHPDTPHKGMTLEELFKKKGVSIDVDAAMMEMQMTAAKFGLTFGNRRMTYNSRLAQEVGLWADDQGNGYAFHMEAFKAYFADGRNIAEKEVLLDLMNRSGLDVNEGSHVIATRSFADAVDADWALSKAKHVTAAPTFFMGLDRLVGAQPYERLENMVKKYC